MELWSLLIMSFSVGRLLLLGLELLYVSPSFSHAPSRVFILHDLVTPHNSLPRILYPTCFHQASVPIHTISTAIDLLLFSVMEGRETKTNPQGPVSLLVGTGGFYANLQPIQTIDDISGSSTSVTINQKEGTDMIFKITDSQNKVGYVQNIKVGSGDDSCLDDSSSPSSSSSAEASSSAAAPVVVETCKFLYLEKLEMKG